ncbi:MAG: HPr family phosphocarrier protein [Coxiellaceae bacterium]|nr:HPr family phosphocarrier protein [Coxiellaceae bacterium]
MLTKKITIKNKLGLHARASMKLINVAGRFNCNITIKHDNKIVDAKDIMNVMGLAASKGTEIELITDGSDEKEAMNAVAELIENRFDEEE